ncbi:OmpA family protein [Bdellovibrio sp. SKB1291214]|uniref:OmpA family protein n=1 Tax=Bdellovibrio sp. SKB1291214 TaxID=1732569 RepID=UPI000B51D652|nr:OmpA family protein [Bdellovibrio sp. SKB1291214]UYL09503.1 OmpA family protein [Bdellovibrio sp. SKB1291214]
MQSRYTNLLIASAFAAGFIGCAGKPTNVTSIPNSADPAVEISRTEEMVNEARAKQMNVLSPDNFKSAERELEKAKDYQADKKSAEKILERVSYSRAWLQQGENKSDISKKTLGEITDARSGALKAGAPNLYSKEWKKLENRLENVTKDVENGSLTAAEKKGPDLVAAYRQIERDSVAKQHLGRAKSTIDDAQKDKAKDKAPKSLALAEGKYNQTMKLIAQDPRNTAAISRTAEDATREADHLAEVMSKVNAGNSEALVLQNERQQRMITNLRGENKSQEQELAQAGEQLEVAKQQEAELARQQALTQAADKIRRELRPNEAEVFTQDGKVMVRLKGLNFASGKSTLTPKNKALLQRVETALNDVPAAKIEVQGHTDSTGKAETNQRISEERAKSVQRQLIANGASSDKVDAIGLGDERPISNNGTAAGRAQNRRIDLVIEPTIQE